VARRFSPLDEELDLLPGALTPSLQEDVVRLSTWMPFARAAQELARLRGVTVAEATARSRTQAAGAAYVAVQTAQAAAIERDAPVPPAGPERQFLSVDGAMVPLVGGRWAEVKTLALGEIEAPRWEERAGEEVVHTTHLSYFSRLTDLATFTRLASVETHRRGTATAGQVAAVLDGAEGNQGVVDYHRPDAVRILDFPHGSGYLGQVAAAVWAAEPAQQAEWLTEQCHELKQGDPAVVLERLRALQATLAPAAGAAAPPALETVTTSLTYLEKRQAQIQYATFQAAGYPIGNGAVESAHKVMVEARLKGAGMHWAPEQVNPMVALRNVAYNDRWAEAWPQVSTELRRQARARTTARRQARVDTATAAAPPAAPPTTVPGPPSPEPATIDQPTWRDDGPPPMVPAVPASAAATDRRRPPADHPWRRGFARRPAA
jgi:hypothetical protein